MNIIVTHFFPLGPIFSLLSDITTKHNRAQAERLGWAYEFSDKRRVAGSIYRERSVWILDVMSRYKEGDNILWIDADAVIIGNNTEEIFKDKGDGDVGLVKYMNEKWNCGVMAFEINKTTITMFEEIVGHNHGDKCHDGWNWNERTACPLAPPGRGPLCESSNVKLTELDRKWNDAEVRKETEIAGFHMLDGYSQVKRVNAALSAREGRA